MLLLRGAAGMAWLLAVEPVIKAAASAAITMPVFIASPVASSLCAALFGGKGRGTRTHHDASVPVCPIDRSAGSPKWVTSISDYPRLARNSTLFPRHHSSCPWNVTLPRPGHVAPIGTLILPPDQRPFSSRVSGIERLRRKMASPEETYRAAILRACEAHLARVKAARDTRVLAVSMARNFEHASRNYRARSAAYAKAKKAYDKAIRSSEAQRAKEEAIALAALRASGEVSDVSATSAAKTRVHDRRLETI